MKSIPTSSITTADIQSALPRVRSALPVTPLAFSPPLSELLRTSIYCKWDLKLRTGSFKERGAVNRLLALSNEERAKGVCAASAGNHALALSYHAARLGIQCTIVMPRSAPLVKVRNTKLTGARVLLEGTTFDEAYETAKQRSIADGSIFVPAFDDPYIIAGQASAGIEIVEQCRDVDTIVIPVGGGGLAAGIILAVRSLKPTVRLIGVQSEWVLDARTRSVAGNEAAIRPVTIADGIAVKGTGLLTKPILDQGLDQLVTVSEGEVANAILRYLEFERTLVEGAGAAALAALLAGKIAVTAKNHVVVLACGGNIDMNVVSRLIQRDMAHQGRLLKVVVSVPDRPGSLNRLTTVVATLGANVLEVQHDRSFSRVPGNVDITFALEVRDEEHRAALAQELQTLGVEVRDITAVVG